MEWTEIIKLYGPQAIPWIGLAYLAKWHLERVDRDMESRTKLAIAIEGWLSYIKEKDRNDKD